MNCSCQSNQPVKENNSQFAKWHGVDRNAIDWQPKIDESKVVRHNLRAKGIQVRLRKQEIKSSKSE